MAPKVPPWGILGVKNGHNAVIYDIKGIWEKEEVDGRL